MGHSFEAICSLAELVSDAREDRHRVAHGVVGFEVLRRVGRHSDVHRGDIGVLLSLVLPLVTDCVRAHLLPQVRARPVLALERSLRFQAFLPVEA